VQGKRVTGVTNGEEVVVVHLTKVVPFLVEDELMGLGTGQNPRIIDQRRPSVSLVRSTNAKVRHRHPLYVAAKLTRFPPWPQRASYQQQQRRTLGVLCEEPA
jgi:hypothetical protein